MAIEAMSCGKPVIVFNNTALPSVTFAPECGIAVENKNSKKLMEAIKLLVEDENERKRRGKLAKKIVKEHYDVNLYNKKMEELCDEVIERKHDFSKKKILDSKIKETKDVIYMKHKLNKLSSILFENNVLTDMLYEIKNTKIDKKYKIDYSDINVQLLINDYNKRVYNNFINKKGKE